MAVAATKFPAAGAGRADPMTRWYIKDAIWAARIAISVALVLGRNTWPIYWQQLAFLIGLAVLTYPVRAVRWGTIYNFFLLGGLWSFAIAGVQYIIEIIILRNSATVFRSVVVASVTEEILKIVPLLLVCIVGRWRFRHSFGACDFMLLAGGLGAGFGLFENLLQGRPFPGSPVSPQIFGWVIFPDSIGGFVGHGASTALIGLCVGYLMYALRWKRITLFAFALVVFATLWMIVDHGMANYDNARVAMIAPARWMWALTGRGTWTPYIFLALIFVTIVFERILLFKVLRRFPRLGPKRWLSAIVRPLRGGVGYRQMRAVVMRIKSLLLYVLAYRQLGYLGAHLKGDTAIDRRAISRSVLQRTIEVMSVQRAVKQS